MGKELLFDTLLHKKTERCPWVPFAGIHAGKFFEYNAVEVLTDRKKLFDSLLKVNEIYRPDGQPILFDLQVEAEILGCELKWSDDTPPTVSKHPLEENKTVPCKCKMPTKQDGRLPLILDVMHKMKKAVGDKTALYGLICGPFTLASHLRGTELFFDMFDDGDYVSRLLDFCKDFIVKIASFYIEAGMDIIAIVDPLVSQISSEHFEEFLNKPYTEIFKYIKEQKAFSSFFVCGDATRNIESMCKTAPDNISVDENIKLKDIRGITEKYNIVLGGNIPLTTVMLHGSQQDNMKYVVNLIDSIDEPHHNLIISPGCDMPYAVPIENTVGAAQAVLEYDKVKEMVKDFEGTDYSKFNIDLPDYKSLKKPFVEVFTLDSASCAACTYMMNTALDTKNRFDDKIDVIEYKFTKKENIARCIKMGVKNLPALYINGELKYSSIIPSVDALTKDIETYLNHKK